MNQQKIWLAVDYKPPDNFGPGIDVAFEVRQALRRMGYCALFFSTNRGLETIIRSRDAAVVFPFAESLNGERFGLRRSLESLAVHYIGSSYSTVSNSSNKNCAYQKLLAAGVTVPKMICLYEASDLAHRARDFIKETGFPLIVKPAISNGGSIGVEFLESEVELQLFASRWNEVESGPMLLEEYIEGCEVTAWVLGVGEEVRCQRLIEIDKKGHKIFDRAAKVQGAFTRSSNSAGLSEPEMHSPPRLGAEELLSIEEIAIKVHKLFDSYSYSRIDLIVRNGLPVVLEINNTPSFQGAGDMAMCDDDGAFENILAELIQHAMNRFEAPTPMTSVQQSRPDSAAYTS